MADLELELRLRVCEHGSAYRGAVMRTRFLLAAAALITAGCATAPDEDRRGSQPLEIVDLVDDFAAFEANSRGLADDARVAAFKAHFAPILPGFYSSERVRFAGYDALIVKALNGWPDDRGRIEGVRDRFAAALAPAQASFEKAFGPLSGYPPIVLVHSLGEFDGGMRSLPGGGRLMFGPDVIARVHGDRDIRPFFHHELFHLMHARSFDDCGALWCTLWTEGLATYVSHRLNPTATDAQLLLTEPVPLRAAVDKDRTAALCPILARLDSKAEDDIRPLFMGRAASAQLPPRAGYFVGYLVAEEIGRARSLKTLATMPAAQLRPLIEASLRRLGDCGG